MKRNFILRQRLPLIDSFGVVRLGNLLLERSKNQAPLEIVPLFFE